MGYTYVPILSYYFLLIISCIPRYFNWILDIVFTEFFVDINLKLGMVITFSREDLCCFCQEKEAPLLGSPPWTSFFPPNSRFIILVLLFLTPQCLQPAFLAIFSGMIGPNYLGNQSSSPPPFFSVLDMLIISCLPVWCLLNY